MATLPQLIEEDIHRMDGVLREYLDNTSSLAALVIDKGGFLITHQGNPEGIDFTTVAALASGAYLANQTIANLVNETNFDSVYQQGEKTSMYVNNVDESCLLVVIFPAKVGVGIVKSYASTLCRHIAAQLKIAHDRDPEGGLDLSVLNVEDSEGLFKKR